MELLQEGPVIHGHAWPECRPHGRPHGIIGHMARRGEPRAGPPVISTTLCACGCGRFTYLIQRNRPHLGLVKGQPRKYAKHPTRYQTDGFCYCGCGNQTGKSPGGGGYRRGQFYRYCPGHSPKVTRPFSTNTRTTRAWARKATPTHACAWAHIGYCQGPIQVAHLDQNPVNNSPSNLLPLCASHHFLYDRGRIDRNNPVMPRFYYDRSGKRRYEYRHGTASIRGCKVSRAF